MIAYLQTKEDIIEAVDRGFKVHAGNDSYEVIRDSVYQYLIWCKLNDNYIGLHGMKGTEYQDVLNASVFYIYL